MTCLDVTIPRDQQAMAPTPISKLLLVAAAVIWDADGRMLLTQRPAGKIYAGRWEFPGGKLEQGETPEMAVVRELREELGLVTSTACLSPLTFVSHTYPEFHVLLPVFSIRQWSAENGATLTGREGQQIAWVRAGQLRDYDLLPTATQMLPVLHEAAENFHR